MFGYNQTLLNLHTGAFYHRISSGISSPMEMIKESLSFVHDVNLLDKKYLADDFMNSLLNLLCQYVKFIKA